MDERKLPQELFDIIIDKLNDDDPRAMQGCSLVCRSWVHSSRRHLFHRIVLSPPYRNYRRDSGVVSHCQRLHKLLLGSPNIAKYIHELKVYEGQEIKGRAWIGSDQTLPLVFGLLTDLTRIELRRLEWDILPLDLRRSICRVLELPSMTSLEIERSDFSSMEDFSSLLSHAEGLTCLSLDEVTTSLEHRVKHGAVAKGQGVGSNHRRRHLLDLRLNLHGYSGASCSQFVDWLLGPQSPLEVSHIRTLHILHFRRSDERAINQLLYTIGGSLRRLKLNDPNLWGDDPIVSINFGRNPGIKSVHLTGIRVGAKRDIDDMLSLKWLMHFLSDVGESSQVEEIQLDVDILDKKVDWSPWEGVDHILAGTNFQSLRTVDVDLSGWQAGSSGPDWYRMCGIRLAARLPLLQARGVLVHIDWRAAIIRVELQA